MLALTVVLGTGAEPSGDPPEAALYQRIELPELGVATNALGIAPWQIFNGVATFGAETGRALIFTTTVVLALSQPPTV